MRDEDADLGRVWLDAVCERFRQQKELAAKAAARLDDAAFFQPLGSGENSVAILMKHMGGNLRSRWTAFLTSDGEKPDRRRDAEFEIEEGDTRERILEGWEEGWRLALGTLGSLEPVDLPGIVTLRGETLGVVAAVERQLAHAAYHTGQIVLLARHLVGEEAWASLSIPRGASDEFTERVRRAAQG
ncbi:MAG TPA: DUF1572 family protein [Longimicrobiales bacterium]|nr:DUF1572 family protein [Longimicrobiales bacterium]